MPSEDTSLRQTAIMQSSYLSLKDKFSEYSKANNYESVRKSYNK